MIQAAIFDMDGLLIDSEPFWRKAEIQIFGEVGIHLTENDCRSTMGYRLNEVVALWTGLHADRPNAEDIGAAGIEVRIIDLITRYILTEAQPMPGVHEAIAICRKAGLKLAIASSSPLKLIKSVVQRFDLKNSFDLIHSAEFETHGKPHPAVFLHTADMLGILPQHCVVFEDAFHGVVAALAARMKVIAIPDSENLHNPRYLAADRILPTLLDFRSDHLLF